MAIREEFKAMSIGEKIKFFFMTPSLLKRRYWAVKYKSGVINVGNNGFWNPRAPSGQSLKAAAKLFNKLNGKVIIEIGSGIQGHFSGNSVLVWAKKTCATRIIALDLDEGEIELVKNATKQYPQVEAHVLDGIEYVKTLEDKIDLLYLDFWTPDKEGDLVGTARANSYLDAYNAAKPQLSDNALILIDDTDHVHPWKHTHIIPAARKDGFVVIHTGRQTLMQKV